jgi:hypothetical protein
MGTRTNKKMVSIISHTRDTELFKKKEKKRRKKLLKQVATMTKLECNSSQNISDCTRRVNNKRKEKKRRRREKREKKKCVVVVVQQVVRVSPLSRNVFGWYASFTQSHRSQERQKEYYLFIYLFISGKVSLSL